MDKDDREFYQKMIKSLIETVSTQLNTIINLSISKESWFNPAVEENKISSKKKGHLICLPPVPRVKAPLKNNHRQKQGTRAVDAESFNKSAT